MMFFGSLFLLSIVPREILYNSLLSEEIGKRKKEAVIFSALIFVSLVARSVHLI